MSARSWRALGTAVEVHTTDPAALDDATRLLAADLDAVDRACSRFRPDAELRRLRPGRQPVGPLLAEVVETALSVAARTGGLVDPTLGRSLVALGYDRTLAALPADGPTGVAVPGRWRELRCGDGELDLPDGVLLDLGATGKSWAADRSAARLAARLGTGVLVNLGGDLAVAGPAPAGGWPVDAAGDVVAVASGGMATSSTVHRTWRRAGRSVHHVLDPRTGRSATTPWATVTVAAGSCVEAGAAALAAVVLADDAPGWLAGQGLPARLVGRDGATVVVAGWPEAA